jgi:hypothetical protein
MQQLNSETTRELKYACVLYIYMQAVYSNSIVNVWVFHNTIVISLHFLRCD